MSVGYLFDLFAQTSQHYGFKGSQLISRSSACSDNLRESGIVLERHKAVGMPVQPRMKIN